MTREELLGQARKHMWAAWALSSEELASQAAATLIGLGMLVPEGGAQELVRLRARVAELERRYLPTVCECGHSRLVHTVPEPHSCFASRGCSCTEYRQLPLAEAERHAAERHAAESVDTLTALFAPTQALPEDEPTTGGGS